MFLTEDRISMKVLVLPDKFKGSLTAKEVVHHISKGVLQVFPGAQIHHALVSDGGDGFLEAISSYVSVKSITVDTVDPLGRPIAAPILFDDKNSTAYIELAKASGLVMLEDSERNPMKTSTYGSGLQFKQVMEMGAKTIYLGLGGSATNDGGIGMAKALGYQFLDASGEELEPIGENLSKIHRIIQAEDWEGISFFAVNDVNNPLFGQDGAAHVYAEQKGASEAQIAMLDQGLRHLDGVVQARLQKHYATIPGAGAAGGAAYGLKTFCNATFLSGVEFILGLSGIHEILERERFDFIITGEGKIDNQTLQGKLISGVVALGKQFEIPVVGVCGKLALSANEQQRFPIDYMVEISEKDMPLSYNMQHAATLLEKGIIHFFTQHR